MSPSLLARLVMGMGAAQVHAAIPPEKQRELRYVWRALARPEQLPPSDPNWTFWVVLAGRGFGKTRTGAEWVREQAQLGKRRQIALVGRTAADVRDVMINGPAGLMHICPPSFRPRYEPSKRLLTFPNGVECHTYSADKPEVLRGPQHDGAWADELAAWRHPEAFDHLRLGLRLGVERGVRPQCVVTTTPRPVDFLKKLLKNKRTKVTRGSTKENSANLAPDFLEDLIDTYEGTRLGRQELDAEVLEDTPGALWTQALIDKLRVKPSEVPPMARLVIAVDPSVSSDEGSNETGIVVVGLGEDDHGYIFDDLSDVMSPAAWAAAAVEAYTDHEADAVVAEVNNGGDLVEVNIRTEDPNVTYRKVHASRGKRTRAEPVATLYEKGRIHHVGAHKRLEDQLTTWTPSAQKRGDGKRKSPDRMDALVWGVTDLMLEGEGVCIV